MILAVRPLVLLGKCVLATILLQSGAGAKNCVTAPFEYAVRSADLVAQVEVLRHGIGAQGMTVQLIVTYAGKAAGPTVRVLGDGPLLSVPGMIQFPVGTRWVMALNRRDQTEGALPADVYIPGGCNEQGLLVSGPVAYGVLQGRPMTAVPASTMMLRDLPAWVRAKRSAKP